MGRGVARGGIRVQHSRRGSHMSDKAAHRPGTGSGRLAHVLAHLPSGDSAHHATGARSDPPSDLLAHPRACLTRPPPKQAVARIRVVLGAAATAAADPAAATSTGAGALRETAAAACVQTVGVLGSVVSGDQRRNGGVPGGGCARIEEGRPAGVLGEERVQRLPTSDGRFVARDEKEIGRERAQRKVVSPCHARGEGRRG